MIKFIAEKCGEIELDGFTCHGIYLHRQLEKMNGCDIVRTRSVKDRDYINGVTEKIITPVTVLIDGVEVEATAFIWKPDRGLIVLPDDLEGMQDAKRKYDRDEQII